MQIQFACFFSNTPKQILNEYKEMKETNGFEFSNRFDEQRLTLRIHRGRGSIHNGSSNNGSPRSPESGRSSVRREKIKISVSYPSTETLNTKCNTLERTPSRCSQVSVHYSNGQTQSQLCPNSRSTHLKVSQYFTQLSIFTTLRTLNKFLHL